jgi:hypothetical protein
MLAAPVLDPASGATPQVALLVRDRSVPQPDLSFD